MPDRSAHLYRRLRQSVDSGSVGRRRVRQRGRSQGPGDETSSRGRTCSAHQNAAVQKSPDGVDAPGLLWVVNGPSRFARPVVPMIKERSVGR